MYEQEATQLMDTLFEKQEVVVMTGGSMMYIDAVCNGIDDIPTVDAEVREHMKTRLRQEGEQALLSELRLVDPDYYAIADLKNTKRIVHALEIYYMTGRPFSQFRTGVRKQRPFRIVKVCLNRQRQVLFERINRRVDLMMEQGLMDAVERIKKNTRVYAKKQLTWFKKDPEVEWIDLDAFSLDACEQKIMNLL